jgi:hypothetical protein
MEAVPALISPVFFKPQPRGEGRAVSCVVSGNRLFVHNPPPLNFRMADHTGVGGTEGLFPVLVPRFEHDPTTNTFSFEPELAQPSHQRGARVFVHGSKVAA